MPPFLPPLHAIGASAVFRHLQPDEVSRALSAGRLHRFVPGDVILLEGEPAKDLWLVVSGTVLVQRRGETGDSVVARRGAGDWVGEAALLPTPVRSASIVAEGEVAALAIEVEPFLRACGGSVRAFLDLIELVHGRMKESDAERLAALQARVQALHTSNRRLRRTNRRLRARVHRGAAIDAFVGSSDAARWVREQAKRAATSDLPLLLLGESGSGKELLARAIHEEGPRAGAEFVVVNCAHVNEGVLASELFGHARGAFTGALRDKRGLVEEASGGTLLLDEVADMPPSLQAALLRFVELGEYRRVGETQTRHADVRLIAATHRSLDAAAELGTFRQDLLYRLDVIRIHIPALRERREDVGLLAAHLAEATALRLGVPQLPLAADTLAGLSARDWPGNVRELENQIERLYLWGGAGPRTAPSAANAAYTAASAESNADLAVELEALKRTRIECALREHEGNRTRAAAALGIERTRLLRWMRGLRIP